MILADGLSRVGQTFNISITTGDDALFAGDHVIHSSNGTFLDELGSSELLGWTTWTNLTLEGFAYGYGWGMDTITSKISAAVLILHAFVALLAIIALCTRRVSYNAWGSVAELLALAFRSSPGLSGKANLQNLGAGIENSDIWRQRLVVKSDSANNLELAFVTDADGKGLLEIEVGKKYG